MADRCTAEKSLKRNLVILVVCLTITAAIHQFLPGWKSTKVDSIKTEMFPNVVGDWVGNDTPLPEFVSESLLPDAVLSRRYINSDGDSVDFLIIAGSNMVSFHDPHMCFPSQGFTIFKENPIKYAVMPDHVVNAFELNYTNKNEGVHGRSVYWYRTPYGVTRSIGMLRLSLGASRLFGMKQKQAFFIRFVSMAPIDKSLPQKSIDELTKALFEVIQKKMPEIF
ncbi:MAG: exosortase C-terminal domain/associated protein EpsI [Armatimonadota bacterium]